jgi:DNA-nicking Smr family endonuclease
MSRQVDEVDARLFREWVVDAQPLDLEQPDPYRRRRPPVPIEQPGGLDEDGGAASLSEAEVETHDYLLFARAGVQKRLVADLQRGYLEVGLELDLHGLSVAYARDVFDDFLKECSRRRVRCARIIHGKGYRSQQRQPVLKRKLNYWLRLRDDVLAFCSATRRDGGTGAVYVLLRNPNKAGRDRARRR